MIRRASLTLAVALGACAHPSPAPVAPATPPPAAAPTPPPAAAPVARPAAEERLTGDLPRLPVALLRQHAHGSNPIVEADYKLCADLNGRVAGVSTLNILGTEINEPSIQALRGWTLRAHPVG